MLLSISAALDFSIFCLFTLQLVHWSVYLSITILLVFLMSRCHFPTLIVPFQLRMLFGLKYFHFHSRRLTQQAHTRSDETHIACCKYSFSLFLIIPQLSDKFPHVLFTTTKCPTATESTNGKHETVFSQHQATAGNRWALSNPSCFCSETQIKELIMFVSSRPAAQDTCTHTQTHTYADKRTNGPTHENRPFNRRYNLVEKYTNTYRCGAENFE